MNCHPTHVVLTCMSTDSPSTFKTGRDIRVLWEVKKDRWKNDSLSLILDIDISNTIAVTCRCLLVNIFPAPEGGSTSTPGCHAPWFGHYKILWHLQIVIRSTLFWYIGFALYLDIHMSIHNGPCLVSHSKTFQPITSNLWTYAWSIKYWWK